MDLLLKPNIMDSGMRIDNVVSCPVKANPDGLKKETAENDFNVVYNDGSLHIDGDFDSARLFSMTGQLLLTTSVADTNVSSLPAGIYCVLIQKGNHSVSDKIVIK